MVLEKKTYNPQMDCRLGLLNASVIFSSYYSLYDIIKAKIINSHLMANFNIMWTIHEIDKSFISCISPKACFLQHFTLVMIDFETSLNNVVYSWYAYMLV